MTNKCEKFLKEAIEKMKASGYNYGHWQACQYELILESDLKATEDTVLFYANYYRTGGEFITEIRLHLQDTFVCNEWGLFLLNTDGRDDVKFEEHTWPDPEYFGEAAAKKAGIFYNADLSFVVNNLIALPGVRTDKFRKYISVIDRRDRGMSGLEEIEGDCLLLPGSKNVYFRLDLPRKTDWKDSEMRIRLRLSGLLFRNATIIT